MSIYNQQPIDLSRVETYPLASRPSKVTAREMEIRSISLLEAGDGKVAAMVGLALVAPYNETPEFRKSTLPRAILFAS